MVNRQYFTLKFTSSFLREMKYKLDITFDDAMATNKMIALADNQILRLIRSETNREVDLQTIEEWYAERDYLKKLNNSFYNRSRIRELQNNIYGAMYIPEYITIVMETRADYAKLFKNGLLLNGKTYRRTSCSASQGRVSTVVFVEEEVSKNVLKRLDNGRNPDTKIVPSKYNAYLGTSGSATKVVSTPRVCIIADCIENRKVMVNWVDEVEDAWEDDVITEKKIELGFNLFDGNGLISPTKAQEWADELDIKHLPAQWCIRASFTKGMLSVFDFVEFCKEKNAENYNVKTLYGEIVDLRDVDVILTESQFKMWSSYSSYLEYEQKCVDNGLTWGVALHTPKFDKNVLELNYQFIQTLKLNDEDVVDLCKQTVEYFDGVTSDDIYYTILFLLGKNLDSENIIERLKIGDNYWVNALMYNHDLINDSYIREKIYETVASRIKDSCIGRIMVEGNFQVIVPDSYAFMQHTCGLKVTGLLKEQEFYSQYWNKKGITVVDAMRSPLTHTSEHNIINIVENDEMNKWFKYYYTGMVANCKDDHTLRFSGSDYDYDIIATTSNKTIVSATYKDELPIVYEPPKANKKNITPQNLYDADTFTFGSIIGAITNKTTNMYALLPLFKEDSKQYKILMRRLKMGCKLQSAQIDKAKIGRKVKGIPKGWVQYSRETDKNDHTLGFELNNSLLCDKHPYFFIYLYRDTYKKYKNYYNGYDTLAKIQFGLSFEEIKKLNRKDKDEREFLSNFKKYLPIIDSDCEMNRICHHMESINFNIKKKLKKLDKKDLFYLFVDKNIKKNEESYEKTKKLVENLKKELSVKSKVIIFGAKNSGMRELKDNIIRKAKLNLNNISSNKYELTNYLVEIFYLDKQSYNKSILYQLCGKYMVEHIRLNSGCKVTIPTKDESGDFVFLNERYSIEEVVIN